MGILHRATDRQRTEHTATAPTTDDPSSSAIRSGTDTTAGEGELTGETKIIGPNAPVAGIATGNGERNSTSPSVRDAGATSRNTEKDTVIDLDGHVASLEKSAETDEKNVDGEEEAEDESRYPKGVPLAILTFGLCMATFVVSGSSKVR